MTIEEEVKRLNSFLMGKEISSIKRFNEKMILIECKEGVRFYIDWRDDGFEFSIHER